MARKAKPKPEAKFRLAINGHELRGEKRAGKWKWTCNTWPGLAQRYAGNEEVEDITAAFTRWALAELVTVCKLAPGEE